jgi:hypothetical protein
MGTNRSVAIRAGVTPMDEQTPMSPADTARTEPQRDEFGYPLCPVCAVAIRPGESVAVRDRAMVHIACRRRRTTNGNGDTGPAPPGP